MLQGFYDTQKDFLPELLSPAKSSAGEKFRVAFLNELARGIKLLVIDESIVNVPQAQRVQVLEFCRKMRSKYQ